MLLSDSTVKGVYFKQQPVLSAVCRSASHTHHLYSHDKNIQVILGFPVKCMPVVYFSVLDFIFRKSFLQNFKKINKPQQTENISELPKFDFHSLTNFQVTFPTLAATMLRPMPLCFFRVTVTTSGSFLIG